MLTLWDKRGPRWAGAAGGSLGAGTCFQQLHPGRSSVHPGMQAQRFGGDRSLEGSTEEQYEANDSF